MTDQTVAVPVDLLKELRASYRSSSNTVGGYREDREVTLEGTAYERIVALIPDPPKVGDTLTAAQVKVADLPTRSVLVDRDGDPWITYSDGELYLAMNGVDDHDEPHGSYGPYTVVYLNGD